MTDYVRQDLLREEQTGRDGYSVGDSVQPSSSITAKAAS